MADDAVKEKLKRIAVLVPALLSRQSSLNCQREIVNETFLALRRNRRRMLQRVFSELIPRSRRSRNTPSSSKNKSKRVWALPRVQNVWFQQLNSRSLDISWKEQFHVSRETFMYICGLVADEIRRQDTVFRRALTVEQRVAVSLWRLATGDSFRNCASKFGIGPSTADVTSEKFLKALLGRAGDFIYFPQTENEIGQARRQFSELTDFPRVIGVLGTERFEVAPTEMNFRHYFDGDQHYSAALQVVVSAEGKFIDVSAGHSACLGHAEIFKSSSLYQRITEGKVLANYRVSVGTCEVGLLLVGAQGYSCQRYLMVPYSDCEPQTPVKATVYNSSLEKALGKLNEVLCQLKGRWGCLQKRLDENPERLPKTLQCCCILHNICKMQGDTFDAELSPVVSINTSRVVSSGEGAKIREAISEDLYKSEN